MRLNVVPLPQTRHPLKGRLPARDEDDVDDVGDVVFPRPTFLMPIQRVFSRYYFFDTNTDTLKIVEILK